MQVGFAWPAGDGVHVASIGDNLQLVNEKSGRISPVRGAGDTTIFTPGSWRPDGGRFAYGTANGRVQIFDDSGEAAQPSEGLTGSVTGVDYAEDGAHVASSDLNGRVALLDASTGSAVGSPVQLPGPVAGVTLAPDGRTAFVVTRADPIASGLDTDIRRLGLAGPRDRVGDPHGPSPGGRVAVGRLLP